MKHTPDSPAHARSLAERLLLACLPNHVSTLCILGDLREELAVRRLSGIKGQFWLWAQVLNILFHSLKGRLESTGSGVTKKDILKMLNIGSDLKSGWRSLQRHPSWAIIAWLTLSIGLGCTILVASLIHGILLKPLPYPEPERIVSISETSVAHSLPVGWISILNFENLKRAQTSFERMALFRGRSMSISGDLEPEYIYGAFVGEEFLKFLASLRNWEEFFSSTTSNRKNPRPSSSVTGSGNAASVLSPEFCRDRSSSTVCHAE